MIAAVWVVLAASAGGGLYGTGRVLARDDMPLRRQSKRQQLEDLIDGVCGLLSLGGQIARHLFRPRPGAHRA